MDISITVDPTRVNPQTDKRLGATGKAHGTFGELLQGSLPGDDDHFLVTLPINRFSYATFYRNDEAGCIRVSPVTKTKSRELARQMLETLAPHLGGELVLRGDLVEGKGLASSSADLVATARAITASLREPVNMEMLLSVMARLEPSDGVMFDSCVVFYHRRVAPGKELGIAPSIRIIAIDEGGTIDTLQYNHKLKPYTTAEKEEYTHLLGQLGKAFEEHNLSLLGQVCTRGALLNQSRNPKRQFDHVLNIAKNNDALGVVVSHSGTMIGVMLSHYDTHFEHKEACIKAELAQVGEPLVVDSLSYNKQGEKPW